jgi:hypothetical protein
VEDRRQVIKEKRQKEKRQKEKKKRRKEEKKKRRKEEKKKRRKGMKNIPFLNPIHLLAITRKIMNGVVGILEGRSALRLCNCCLC